MRLISVYGAVFFFTIMPTIAFGADPVQLVPCDGPDCTTGDVIELSNRILRFFVSVAIVIAAIMIAWGGFTMVTAGGEPGKVSKGRSFMTNAIIGIIIVLAAWLLIDTVMKLVLRDPESWKTIQDLGQTEPTATQPGTGGVTAGPPTQPGTVSAGQLAHVDALDRLRSQGNITVTSTAGPSGVQAGCSGAGCTSLQGVREDTVNQVINIAESCSGCSIVVVGATEGGVHAGGSGQTHANGYKVDIDDSPQVDSFFTSSLTRSGSRTGDARYLDRCGNEYVRESTHWDITVSNGACSI